MPGLVDAHCHINQAAGGHEALLGRAVPVGRDDDAVGGQRQARSRAAVPPNARGRDVPRSARVHRGPGLQRQRPVYGAPTFKPTTPGEARANVRSLKAQRVDVIKIWMTNPKFPPEVITAIVDEARQQGIPVTAHVTDVPSLRQLADQGVTDFLHTPVISR